VDGLLRLGPAVWAVIAAVTRTVTVFHFTPLFQIRQFVIPETAVSAKTLVIDGRPHRSGYESKPTSAGFGILWPTFQRNLGRLRRASDSRSAPPREWREACCPLQASQATVRPAPRQDKLGRESRTAKSAVARRRRGDQQFWRQSSRTSLYSF